MSVNKVILVGYLGQDPESRTLKSGTNIANFSLATSSKQKGADGQWKDETEWHRCVCFGNQADFAAKYLTKGRLVYVEGRIKSGKYTDKNGVERVSYDIICDVVRGLGKGDDAGQSRQSGGNSGSNRAQSNTQARRQAPANDAGFGDGDDDIPF